MDSILNALSDMLYVIIDFLLGWVNLPAFPEALSNSINSFLNLIFGNLSLLGFFIRPSTLRVAVPILVVLMNFEVLYKVIVWIIKKIPFLNIS